MITTMTVRPSIHTCFPPALFCSAHSANPSRAGARQKAHTCSGVCGKLLRKPKGTTDATLFFPFRSTSSAYVSADEVIPLPQTVKTSIRLGLVTPIHTCNASLSLSLSLSLANSPVALLQILCVAHQLTGIQYYILFSPYILEDIGFVSLSLSLSFCVWLESAVLITTAQKIRAGRRKQPSVACFSGIWPLQYTWYNIHTHTLSHTHTH